MTVEEQVELVGTFVRGVVERFGYEATTTTRIEDDRLYVDVTGEDLGLLIGPRGSTLDALQELARTVVQRRGDERALRVVVDVAGFRARRAAALESLTRRRAAEVLEADCGSPRADVGFGPEDRPRHREFDRGVGDRLRRDRTQALRRDPASRRRQVGDGPEEG